MGLVCAMNGEKNNHHGHPMRPIYTSIFFTSHFYLAFSSRLFDFRHFREEKKSYPSCGYDLHQINNHIQTFFKDAGKP